MKEEKVLKKYSRLNIEEKAPRIVKHTILGLYKYAKTFGLMTAQNPMGIKADARENNEAQKEFWGLLKRGGYHFIKVVGQYGNVENPVLILNIPRKELIKFGDMFNQESVIFGTIEDYRKVTFEYWGRAGEGKPLKLLDLHDKVDVLNNPKDFYTRIKNWKFSIPFSIFQEAMIKWYDASIGKLSESGKEKALDLIEEIVEHDERYTYSHFYKKRVELNSLIKSERVK